MQYNTILKDILRFLKAFKETIILIGFYLPFGITPASPDLIATYSEADFFSTPTSESDAYRGKNDIRSIITLTISNNSNRDIEDLEVTINDVAKIESIYGRSSLNKFNSIMSDIVKLDEEIERKFILKNINRIPQGHNIEIQLYGYFYTSLFEKRIDLNANTNKIQYIHEHLSSGKAYYIEKYLNIILSLVLLFFIYIAFKRFYLEVKTK
jgi:hypothetical protein